MLAQERLDDNGHERLVRAAARRRQRRARRHRVARQEAVREFHTHIDAGLALEWVDQLSEDMRDSSPSEIRQLGRTLRRWREQIAVWHAAQVTTDRPSR